MKTTLIILISTVLLCLFIPVVNTSYAASGGFDPLDWQEPTIPKPDLLPGPESDQRVYEKSKTYFTSNLLPTLTKGIVASAGGFAFIILIIGGIRYLTAYGNEEQQTAARNTIMWAIIGLIIAILSYAIVSIIVSIIQPPAPPAA